jgi:hypothetical protein
MEEFKVNFWSIQEFVQRLQRESGFSFARFGDGTFFCLQGVEGENCDGVVYTPGQAKALREVLTDKEIYHGIGDLAISEANAPEWLKANGYEVEWYDANVLNTAAFEGRLFPFVEWMRTRRTIMVGPPHLETLGAFPIRDFIPCHPTQAFEQVDDLETEIWFQVQKHRADTVLLSAGQGASPTLVSRLHRDYPDKVVIDTGSVWDPFVGVYSRKKHRQLGAKKLRELGRSNFKQDIVKWQTT